MTLQKNILFFSSSTCGPCRHAKSILTEETVKELNLNIKNYTAEDNWEVFSQYQVASVPTFILVDEESKEVNRKVGFKTIEDIKGL